MGLSQGHPRGVVVRAQSSECKVARESTMQAFQEKLLGAQPHRLATCQSFNHICKVVSSLSLSQKSPAVEG